MHARGTLAYLFGQEQQLDDFQHHCSFDPGVLTLAQCEYVK